jgi:iron complex outermembrane receptor protein
MRRIKTIACSLGLILVGVTSITADADSSAPASLRMRAGSDSASPRSGPRWNPVRWGKRIAQAATNQPSDPAPAGNDSTAAQPADTPAPADAPPAADTPAPADTPPAEPAPAPEAAPAQAPGAATAPPLAVEQSSQLSDEELAKLSEQSAKEEVITITGSTIERKTLTTPAPLTILNRQDLAVFGRATVGDILQSLPEQSNAINAQANNGGDGSTRISIRGLGANRTLTLLNGRRVVAGGSGANTSVDFNAIPLAMIERVEVLKDGASAVYGSDAIGGVVNIITRSDFNGSEASIYTGGTSARDGFTYDASFVTGYTAQDKKGNIVFSAGIQNQKPIMAGERTFSDRLRSFDYNTRTETTGNITTAPSGYLNAKAGIAGPNGGKAVPRDICGMGVDFCTSDGMGGFRKFTDADLYNPQPDNYLLTPSSRYNVYSTGTYKLVPHVSTFFEASYLNRTSDQMLAPTPFSSAAPISKDSMYNPFGADVLDYQRRLSEFGNRRFFQGVDTFRIVGGFQGTIPEDAPALQDWKWELSYNYGHTGSLNRNQGNLIKSRLAQSLGPSMLDASGRPVCVRTPGNLATAITGCVPMNILGPAGSIDPAAAGWVTFTGVSGGFNQQQTLLAQTHGRVVELPNHGDVSVAVGADYRIESGGTNPDPLTSTGDTTGNAQQPTAGKYRVAEGFGELSVVPISGQKFAEWVELNLAARGFRYDTFGSGVTWKAGGLFRTINGVAVRGTYSTAFRAPSISDLFQGTADSFPANLDPCNTASGTIPLSPTAMAKCAAQGVPLMSNPTYADKQQRTVVGGNPDLKAETAKVVTAGIVLEPPQAKGLSLTADYWHIDITDAIQSIPASVILSNCYVQGLDPYCNQVHRNPALNYKIDFITNTTQNVGGTVTSGLDLAAALDRSLGKIGRFRSAAELQYLFKYNIDNSVQILHARGNYDFGVFPKYKANFTGQYGHDSGVGGGFNVRYIGSFEECNNRDCNHGQPSRDINSWAKLDVFGSYTATSRAGKTTLAVGINNLTNNNPAVIYTGFAGTSDSSTYDYQGRFMYMRLSQNF